jgi:exonuclease SbcC
MEGELRQADDLRKALANDIGDLERQLARAQAAAQDLLSLGRELVAKEQRQQQLAAELQGIPTGFDERRHAELERELDSLSVLNEQATRLNERVDREVSTRAAFGALAEKLAAARQRLNDLSAQYQESRFFEEELQRQRAAFEGAQAAVRYAELELQAATAEETRAAEAAATAERDRKELERARALHARLESERRVHEELDRAYTDLRTELNAQLRPELSDVAALFLNDLTGGRYNELEIDDNYNLVLYEDGIPKPVISGGEEDVSSLALRLAISQMIADRAGQMFSLLVLDEVFGSLDPDRQRRVVDLLRRLGDRFEQVILISHVDVTQYDVDHGFELSYDDSTGSTTVRPFATGDDEAYDLTATAEAVAAEL